MSTVTFKYLFAPNGHVEALNDHHDQQCEILAENTDSDIETGPWWTVRFADGHEASVQLEELHPAPRSTRLVLVDIFGVTNRSGTYTGSEGERAWVLIADRDFPDAPVIDHHTPPDGRHLVGDA